MLPCCFEFSLKSLLRTVCAINLRPQLSVVSVMFRVCSIDSLAARSLHRLSLLAFSLC